MTATCRPSSALALFVLLASSPPPPGAWAQQASQDESRLVDWAARLDASDRSDEALAVLAGLLDEHPNSVRGLALLLEVAARRERIAPFLPRFERAGADDAALGSLKVLWIDALLAAGEADSARSVVAGWTEARPTEAGAYLAWSRLEKARADPEAAAEVLQRGRRNLGDPSAFAVELGILFLQTADYRAAADEWLRLTRADGDASVLEQAMVGDEVAREAFVDAVSAMVGGMPPAAAGAASRMMLRFDAPEPAGELARDLERRLAPAERQEFLARFAEEARSNEAHGQAAWAAERLADLTADPVRRASWRAVAADMALQAGDSTRARGAFAQLLRSTVPGTEAHGVASRRLFNLTLYRPDQAERLLAEYQRSYPQPESELAEMRIELARSFVRAGRLSDAERIVASDISAPPAEYDAVPHARLAVELGRIRLYAGDVAGSIRALGDAAGASDSDVGTRASAIRLAGVLTSTDSAGARRFGRALHLIARRPAPEELEQGLGAWESGEVLPEAMALAAIRLDEAGFSRQAAALRGRLIDRYPESPESPVALLAIARYERDRHPLEVTDSSAVSRLERLILEYPQSAVAPLARRLRAEWLAASPPRDGGG